MELTNPQWETFAQHVARYPEGAPVRSEAARQAGYTVKNAAHSALELMKRPAVISRIAEIRARADGDDRSIEGHLNRLAAVYRAALDAKSYSIALNAELARGKALGWQGDKPQPAAIKPASLAGPMLDAVLLPTREKPTIAET